MARHFKPKAPPIPFLIQIEGLSHEGRGIGTVQGKKKFLRRGLVGETVMAIDTRQHRSYDEGEVIEVIQAAPDRVTPPCAHTRICGGCSLQHLHPDSQIAFKQAALIEQLAHIAGVQSEHILPPLTGPTVGYRHKARLGVKYVPTKQTVLVGFREINGRYLADIQSCSVLHPSVGQKISLIRTFIHTLEAHQSIPQIEVAVGENKVALVFRHLLPLSETDSEKFKRFGMEEGFDIYLQPGGIDSISHIDEKREIRLEYTLPQHQVVMPFHPTDFTQINPEINRKMVNRAIELLDPQPHESLLDLFCGLGNFTLPLARYCKSIVGIEGETNLVARASQNAALNQIHNATFYVADLSAHFADATFMNSHVSKVLLDPPRTGALEVVKLLPMLKPSHILYISCNSATLARDTKELIERGYHLSHVGVMDMFPHTSHVESMALFQA